MKAFARKFAYQRTHLILAGAGITGMIGFFLPFTMSVSPLAGFQYENVWRIAAPMTLSVFIAAATIRWIISGTFSRMERILAYTLSLAAAVMTVSLIFTGEWEGTVKEIIYCIMPFLVLIPGAYLLFYKSQTPEIKSTRPITSLQVAYVANCLFCLAMFWPENATFFAGGWQIGAYFCLIASMVYTTQIILFFKKRQKNDA